MNPDERPAGTREVVIVQVGRYNGWDDRVRVLEVGDRLVTREWYARSLVEGGLARWPAESEPVDVDQVEQAVEGMLAMDLVRAEEAEKVLQEPPRASQSGEGAGEGAAAVGMARSARSEAEMFGDLPAQIQGERWRLVVPANVVAELRKQDLDSAEALRQASDEELLAVPGIGKGRLGKLREALG